MADCLFCQIVDGTIPADILRRDEEVIAFRDIDPKAPVHVLVIPTRHLEAARDADGPEGERLLGRLIAVATEVASELGLGDGGYRLVTNTGPDGGQAVYHLHWHLLGGRAMAWPPG